MKCKANLSIGEETMGPSDDCRVEVELLYDIQKACFEDIVNGTLNIKEEDGKYLLIVVGLGYVV